MKNIGFIMMSIIALVMAACDSDDNTENSVQKSWNATEEFVGTHSDFDAAAIPAELLKMGMIYCADEWYCKAGKLYYYESGDRDGWEPMRVIFFEDGTCWHCWHALPGPDGGPKYRVYTWSYDPETAVISTSYMGDDAKPWTQNLKAQVKAFDGNRLVLDGDLCNCFVSYDGIYLRMLMKPESAEERQWWLDNAQLKGFDIVE